MVGMNSFGRISAPIAVLMEVERGPVRFPQPPATQVGLVMGCIMGEQERSGFADRCFTSSTATAAWNNATWL